MTTYRGYDVCDVPPNDREDAAERWGRGATRIGGDLGRYAVVDVTGVTARGRRVLWTCFSADAITDAEAFLAARQGRLVPFWLPTWQRDYTLTDDVAPADATLTIRGVSYTTRRFPLAHRRDLALVTATAVAPLRVTDADVSGDDELLALEGAAGVTASASHTMVSQLLFGRLTDDAQTIVRYSPTLAELAFEFVELPHEVPA